MNNNTWNSALDQAGNTWQPVLSVNPTAFRFMIISHHPRIYLGQSTLHNKDRSNLVPEYNTVYRIIMAIILKKKEKFLA